MLDRLDQRHLWETNFLKRKKLAGLPREYFKNHFVVTTSGMNFQAPLLAALAQLSPERVQFATDHAVATQENSVRAIEAMPRSIQDRWTFWESNVRRVFALRGSENYNFGPIDTQSLNREITGRMERNGQLSV